MHETEINSILNTNDSLRFHLISGENYIGRFDRDEQTGYIRLVDLSITFPIWSIKRVQTIPIK